MVDVLKEKGDALTLNTAIEGRVRKIAKKLTACCLDLWQGGADAIFIVHQLQQRYLAKKKVFLIGFC